jgi:predicted nucleic acid-binding protein
VAKRSPQRRRPVRKPASQVPPVQVSVVSLRYIESSALLAALLEHDASMLAALQADGRYVTSALTIAVASRAIIRARAAGRLTAALEQAAVRGLRTFERRCFIVDVNSVVLARVSRPFPVEPIRTLDAVHLATAELLGEPPQLVTIVTRDARVRDNARALGYAVE